MAATTLRHPPVPPRVALRALAAAVVALVAGGWLMFVIVVVATGGDLTTGSSWWLVLAGGAACVSGVVIGSTGQTAPAAVIAVIAVACVVLADSAAQPQERGGDRQAALAVRGQPGDASPPAETAAGRSRGNAAADPGAQVGDASPPAAKARGASPPVTKAGEVAPPATNGADTAPPTAKARDTAPPTAKARDTAPPTAKARDTAPPIAATGTPDAAAASGVIASYYAALDRHDYASAWARLAPAVQAAFGGFETWRSGYATTLAHRVEDVAVQPGGSVRHVLVATDRTPCGRRTEQRFAMTWRLTGTGPGWRATALSAVKIAGVDPAAAC